MTFVKFNISMEKETRKKLEAIAKEDNRSISNMISHLILSYTKEVKRK